MSSVFPSYGWDTTCAAMQDHTGPCWCVWHGISVAHMTKVRASLPNPCSQLGNLRRMLGKKARIGCRMLRLSECDLLPLKTASKLHCLGCLYLSWLFPSISSMVALQDMSRYFQHKMCNKSMLHAVAPSSHPCAWAHLNSAETSECALLWSPESKTGGSNGATMR